MPAPFQQPIRAGLRRLLLGSFWSLVAIALIWAGIVLHLLEQREQALDAALGNADELASTYEDSLIHGLGEIDQALLYVRALHARDGPALDLVPWVDSAEQATRSALRIRITDRNGAVILNDRHRPTTPIDLSARPYFRHFAEAAPGSHDDGTFIGTPELEPGSDRWLLPFTRALTTAEGAFDGIVTIAVDPATLGGTYRTLHLGRRGVATLTGLDGIIRARLDATGGTGAGVIGQRSLSPAVARVAAEAEGSFAWRDPGDGVTRVVSFRRDAGYPLLIEVALATDDVLRGLDANLVVVVSAGLALSVAVGMAGAAANRRTTGLARALRALGAALEHIDLGLIIVDPNGGMAVVNQRAIELLDIPERFTSGERFAALLDWQRQQGEFKHGEPPQAWPQRTAARPEPTAPNCYRRMRPNGMMLEVRTQVLPGGWALRSFAEVTAVERRATGSPPDARPAADEPAARRQSPANHLAVEHLTATLGDDAVAGIVASFLDGLPGQLGRMRDLAQGGDTEALRREMHALADSAATIGLDELGAAASELEQDLRRRGVTAAATRLDRIDRLGRSGLDRLAAYLHDRAA